MADVSDGRRINKTHTRLIILHYRSFSLLGRMRTRKNENLSSLGDDTSTLEEHLTKL
jgi:hypothetical protein